MSNLVSQFPLVCIKINTLGWYYIYLGSRLGYIYIGKNLLFIYFLRIRWFLTNSPFYFFLRFSNVLNSSLINITVLYRYHSRLFKLTKWSFNQNQAKLGLVALVTFSGGNPLYDWDFFSFLFYTSQLFWSRGILCIIFCRDLDFCANNKF